MRPPPFAREIDWRPPLEVFAGLRHHRHAVFLDSATAADGVFDARARYSYIAVDPSSVLRGRDFAAVAEALAPHRRAPRAGLPPFQGGAIGYFGYEMGGLLEKLPAPKPDPLRADDMVVGLYDTVISFDHAARRAWIVSAEEPDMRWEEVVAEPQAISAQLIETETRATHEARVARTIEYILDGDIFQANLALRFRAALKGAPFDLYRRLRSINPAPFSAFLDFGDIALVSASPERFLKYKDGEIETRPIKGTRPRGATPAEDATQADALKASAKDRAENVMIVDLLRNDLAKVARDRTVEVHSLCALESYASVHHLVSTLTARLRPELGPLDLLAACFPGGSVTGAPKIRAMEIIHDLEIGPRGPYCGAIGWIGYDGTMDSSIVIRTLWIKDGIATFQAGGGITARSDPAAEYDEAIAKAAALAKALGLARDDLAGR